MPERRKKNRIQEWILWITALVAGILLFGVLWFNSTDGSRNHDWSVGWTDVKTFAVTERIRGQIGMRMRKKISRYLLLGVLFSGMLMGCSGGQEKVDEDGTQSEHLASAEKDIFAMDTYMTVTAYGDRAKDAVDAAEQEINRLDRLLSAQNSESEIFIINENGSEILSEDTAILVEKSLELFEDTGGLFDITVYPLMQEWGFTTGEYKVPEKGRLKKLLQYVDASGIEYESSERLLTLPDRVKIDLGGIAKGYTSGRIMEIFQEYGIQSGIVSLGGNVQTYGAKEDGSLWKVAIQNPDTSSDNTGYIGILETKDKAVITSGGYERYFEQDDKVYHHILNPTTGYPAEAGLSSVTIVSGDGTLADGLSTSLFIMGKEKALEYWRNHAESFDGYVLLELWGIGFTSWRRFCRKRQGNGCRKFRKNCYICCRN